MKKNDVIHQLHAFYDVPAPERKAEFLRSHREAPMSLFQFFLLQVRFIKWTSWVMSLVIWGVMLFACLCFPGKMIWGLSAMAPFLATTLFTEIGRSRMYGMEEIEMVTRFSLKATMYAKMTIIGVLHFMLFVVFLPICMLFAKVSVITGGIYFITPYLLTVSLGTYTLRKNHGQTGYLCCLAESIFISFMNMFAGNAIPMIFAPEFLKDWIIALILGLVFAIREEIILGKEKEVQFGTIH